MAILEVYLEATPTVFIYIMLFMYSINSARISGYTPQEIELGIDEDTSLVQFLAVQFLGSFILSIFSAAFGIAR